MKKLENMIFFKNLALMHDTLKELADLSDALQKGDITLAKAARKIERQIDIFRYRKENHRNFYAEALSAIADGNFQGVVLSHIGKHEREIDYRQFYQGLIDSMTAWLLLPSDKKLTDLTSVIQPDIYQGQFAPDHGETELREYVIDSTRHPVC